MAQGRTKKAAEALKHAKCLCQQPSFTLIHDLAQCQVALKEYSLAEENCKQALTICRNKAVYKLLTVCLIQQAKITEAIEVFRTALR